MIVDDRALLAVGGWQFIALAQHLNNPGQTPKHLNNSTFKRLIWNTEEWEKQACS